MPNTHTLIVEKESKIREKINITKREIGELEEQFRKADRDIDKQRITNLLLDANLRLDTYITDSVDEGGLPIPQETSQIPQITGDFRISGQETRPVVSATPVGSATPVAAAAPELDLAQLMAQIELNSQRIQQLAIPSPIENEEEIIFTE